MPKQYIPCFNSTCIEQFIAYIPNLQDNFLYGNDDTFFGDYVLPEDFYVSEKPIVRVKTIKSNILNNKETEGYSYYGTIKNALDLLKKRYGKELCYTLHHNIDAYNKSMFIESLKRYEEELTYNCFREENDISRVLFSLDVVCNRGGQLRVVDNPRPWRKHLHFIKNVYWESYTGVATSWKSQREILKYKPKFFCLNAGDDCTISTKKKMKEFMETLFPTKSKFEKDTY